MKWYIYISIILAVVILAGVLAGPDTFITVVSQNEKGKELNLAMTPGLFELKREEGFETKSVVKKGISVPQVLINLPGGKRGVLVHERLLYGYPGQTPIDVLDTEKEIASVYNPFGYGMPKAPTKSNMSRMYRLYVVYSDNMTTEGELKIHMCSSTWATDKWENCKKKVTFTANRTWGDATNTAMSWHRDMYTDMKSQDEVFDSHSKIFANVTVKDKKAVIRQITLQAYDIIG